MIDKKHLTLVNGEMHLTSTNDKITPDIDKYKMHLTLTNDSREECHVTDDDAERRIDRVYHLLEDGSNIGLEM